jgi:hypothetical protein
MKNLMNQSKFLLKSMLLACILLFVNAIESNAQTPYAQLTFNPDYSNWYESGGNVYHHYTTRIDFYSDPECMIPAPVPDVTINYQLVATTNCGSRQEFGSSSSATTLYNYGFNSTGTACHLELYDYGTAQYEYTNNWYELKPGTGYLIGSPNFLLGGPADYCP